jgi:cation diffusion facilitator family transporter
MAEPSSPKIVIYAALAGNLLVALTKFVAAFISGSSSMMSEGVHSVVDTANEGVLLYGLRRAREGPDEVHPLGHGRELYFWSFIVAVLLFALGAGVSIYQGIARIRAPEPIENVTVSYVVLALSFLFEGISWRISQRSFGAAKGDLGWWEAVRKSKDPSSFAVLFEDTAALIGIAFAALGIFLADRFAMPVFDGIASIMIGLVLAASSALLARESKGLLIGERADPQIAASIEAIAAGEPGIAGANGVLTTHLAPDQIVVALSLEFDDALRTPQIEAAVVHIEQRVRADHPEVVALFVKPQTPGAFERARRSAAAASDHGTSAATADALPDTPGAGR